MTKEQLLEDLKALRNQLPSGALIDEEVIKNEQAKGEYVTFLARKAVETIDKITNIENLESDEILNKEIERLNKEINDTEWDLTTARKNLTLAECDSLQYKNDLYFLNAELIIYEGMLENAKEDTREQLEQKTANYKKQIDEKQKAYTLSVQSTRKLNDEIKKLEEKFNELNSKRFVEVEKEKKEAAKRYNDAITKRIRDVDYLRTKLGFINHDVIPTLDNLIESYEKDEITPAEIGYRVDLIKQRIFSNPRVNKMVQMYADEIASVSFEQEDILNNEIELLNNKLSDDTNYIISEEDYNKKLEDLKATYKRKGDIWLTSTHEMDVDRQILEGLINNSLDSKISESYKKVLEEDIERVQNRINKNVDIILQNKNEYTSALAEFRKLSSINNRFDKERKLLDIEKLEELIIRKEEAKYYSEINYSSVNNRLNRIVENTLGIDYDLFEEDELSFEEQTKIIPTENKEPEITLTSSEKENADNIILPIDDLKEEEKQIPGLKFKNSNEEQRENYPVLPSESLTVIEDDEVIDVHEPKPSLFKKIKEILKRAGIVLLTLALMISNASGLNKAGKENNNSDNKQSYEDQMLDKKENKQKFKEEIKEEVKEEPKKETQNVAPAIPGHYDYSSNIFTPAEESNKEEAIENIEPSEIDNNINLIEENEVEQELNNTPFDWNWEEFNLENDTPNRTMGG